MTLPKGVHRVKRKLANGTVRWHFYAWRGGPKFWKGETRQPKEYDFFRAFADAIEQPEPIKPTLPQIVDKFLSSASMPIAKRSRQDLEKWALRFAEHFRDAPVEIFEERGARAELNTWRQKWVYSPKQHDMAGVHAVRILNWAVEEGYLSQHNCQRLPRLYRVDRSEVVWTAQDRKAINAIAPKWIRRLLCAACETGLRPGDLVRLSKSSVEHTPSGRRLRVRTNKRGRVAHIPITEAMAPVIDATPRDRMLVLTNATDGQLTEHRASEGLRQWRDKAGLRRDLRLQDCRGTAATRLLNAGLSLSEIAGHMGWSLRHASNVIEHYARVSPSESDAVLVKLAAAKRGGA